MSGIMTSSELKSPLIGIRNVNVDDTSPITIGIGGSTEYATPDRMLETHDGGAKSPGLKNGLSLKKSRTIDKFNEI